MGLLCVKGRFGTSFVNHPDRLTQPLIRRAGGLEPATWDEALELVADKFAEHRGAFGAFSSAKATNEDNYLLQKLVRAVMVDEQRRPLHAALSLAVGRGDAGAAGQRGDLELVQRLRGDRLPVRGGRRPVVEPSGRGDPDAPRDRPERGAALIVLNPKRIELCDHTDVWLREYPGTDVAVLNGMARVILDEGLADEQFIEARTEGYAGWLAALDEYTPERVEELSGVPAELLRRAARLYARPRGDAGGGLLPDLGDGRHPAHQRHRQRDRVAQSGAADRAGGSGGQRGVTAARAEQRAGRGRRGLRA